MSPDASYRKQPPLGEAEAVFVEAPALWRSVRFPVGLGLCLSNLGRVASRAGRWAEALDHFVDARAHFVRIGADAFLVELDAREAERLVLCGDGDEAFAVASDAAVRSDALGGMPVVLTMLGGLGVSAVPGAPLPAFPAVRPVRRPAPPATTTP